jgi:hypothetical protein
MLTQWNKLATAPIIIIIIIIIIMILGVLPDSP